MARATKKLNARMVTTVVAPGRHSDGDGLYLIVDASGAKRWLFMFRWQGKLKEMGLGGLSTVSLADARTAATEARRVVASVRNPIEQRRAERSAREDALTFGAFADQLAQSLSTGFSNSRHQEQWAQSFKDLAVPIRSKAVDAITTDDVLTILAPIWQTKFSTASRIRGRIERVLDAARARGLRTGENPARWRGHLDHLLPKRSKADRRHFTALSFQNVPDFMVRLRSEESVPAIAIEFLILTAARSGEARGATWSEIDRPSKIWTIPASRMKAGNLHRVPLSDSAVQVLEKAEKIATGDYVFAGRVTGKPLAPTTMLKALRRFDPTATVHGFRSSFRDWAGEMTNFPRDLAETALAHTIGDETERAYRRGDALEKRRKLMEAWAAFVGKGRSGKNTGNVVEMRRA